MNYNIESKNLLANGRILNFLNNSLQDTFLLELAIFLIFSFECKILFCCQLIFPENYSIGHDGMEVSKENYFKVSVVMSDVTVLVAKHLNFEDESLLGSNAM
jgi:hypothetical protein